MNDNKNLSWNKLDNSTKIKCFDIFIDEFSVKNNLIRCDSTSPALLLIQNIRDEAHRFAITAHRQKRKKRRDRSFLEEINGIGSKRKQVLIKHFGGLQGVSKAGINELSKVNGINRNLAKKIYETIHDNDNS